MRSALLFLICLVVAAASAQSKYSVEEWITLPSQRVRVLGAAAQSYWPSFVFERHLYADSDEKVLASQDSVPSSGWLYPWEVVGTDRGETFQAIEATDCTLSSPHLLASSAFGKRIARISGNHVYYSQLRDVVHAVEVKNRVFSIERDPLTGLIVLGWSNPPYPLGSATKILTAQHQPRQANYFGEPYLTAGPIQIAVIEANGLVRVHSTYSWAIGVGYRPRWEVPLPRGSQVVFTPHGDFYAAVPTPAGLEARFYDTYGQLQSRKLVLPEQVKSVSVKLVENGYGVILASASGSETSDTAYLIRVNPESVGIVKPLTSRLLLNYDPMFVTDNFHAYVMLREGTTEHVRAFDVREWRELWRDQRDGQNDTDAKLLFSSGSLFRYGNTSSNGSMGVLVRRFREDGFRLINVELPYGGGSGRLDLDLYGPRTRNSVFDLTCSDPDVQLASNVRWIGAGDVTAKVLISIPHVTQRKVIRFTATDRTSGETRLKTIVMEPWVDPDINYVKLRPETVVGGTPSMFLVVLKRAAQPWTIARCTSNGPEAIIPATFNTWSGQVGRIPIQTLPVTVKKVRILTITLGTKTLTEYIHILP